MRILGCFALGIVVCGNAMALETSAGADTVNSSQVGITAKIDATNAITTAGINQILNCQKAGKLYDPTTNTCIAVDEPLAKKIAACTTSKQFYNQNTGACMASAPDLTTNLNDTNTLLNKIIACNNAKQFYNSAAGTCTGGSASIAQTYVSPVYNIAKNRTPQSHSLGNRDLCVINYQKGMTSQPRGGCQIGGSPGANWTLTIYSWDDSAIWCQATCYGIR
ncbi:MAG: hypothetical protein JSR99_03465 [Proteobacteria bacterium]|nr:hypothetical protein [Pseudomonadota bacterium]